MHDTDQVVAQNGSHKNREPTPSRSITEVPQNHARLGTTTFVHSEHNSCMPHINAHVSTPAYTRMLLMASPHAVALTEESQWPYISQEKNEEHEVRGDSCGRQHRCVDKNHAQGFPAINCISAEAGGAYFAAHGAQWSNKASHPTLYTCSCTLYTPCSCSSVHTLCPAKENLQPIFLCTPCLRMCLLLDENELPPIVVSLETTWYLF